MFHFKIISKKQVKKRHYILLSLYFSRFTKQILPEKVIPKQQNVISENRTHFSCTKWAICHHWGLQPNHTTVQFFLLMVSIFTTVYKLVVCYGLDLLPQIQSEKTHNKTMASWIFEEVVWFQKEGNIIIYLPFCSLHLFNHTSLCGG